MKKQGTHVLMLLVMGSLSWLPISGQGLFHRIDSILTERYYCKGNIDTAYIMRPSTKWTITARMNVSGSKIETKGISPPSEGVAEAHFKSEIEANRKATLSVGVSYLGLSLSASLNPAKLMGKYHDFELNFNSYGRRFGFDIIYQDAKNFKGWHDHEGMERIELPDGMLSVKTLNLKRKYGFLFVFRSVFTTFAGMKELLKYFPQLTEEQQRQLAMLDGLYRDWNAKINVISRKDIDNLYEHHVLHSMAIAKMVNFRPGTRILDLGTGGGFPGIPLAILFPECRLKLIDGTGKKIRVAQGVAEAIGLKNCEACQLRGEEERGRYDFVVSRAVMPLPDLVKMVRKNIAREQRNSIANGVVCLKGGDLQAETSPFRNIVEVTELSQWFDEEWFRQKNVVYLPMG